MDKQVGKSLKECVVLVVFFLCSCSTQRLVGQETGIWSAKGSSLLQSSGTQVMEVTAPNGNVKITYTSDGLVLRQNSYEYLLSEVVSAASLTEVIWSPDSRHVIVNASDGGVVGTWDSFLYSINDNGAPILIKIRDVLGSIASEFPRCTPSEIANIGTIEWLDGSYEILVAIESPPHSTCRNMGDVKGVRIAVPSWVITDSIPESILRRDWVASLGPRFIAN